MTVNSSGDRARRSGKLKVYSTQKACNADTKGSRSTDVLSAKIVNYKYSKNVTTTKKATSGNNISIVFLTPSGSFLARVEGKTKGNVLLRKKQYEVAADEQESLKIARNTIVGKVYNGYDFKTDDSWEQLEKGINLIVDKWI